MTPTFILVHDRGTGDPIMLAVAEIIAVWTAITPPIDEADLPERIGANIFLRTPHGVGDTLPRIQARESVADIATQLGQVS